MGAGAAGCQSDAMGKAGSILAVIRDAANERALLERAKALALRLQARLDVTQENLAKRPPGPGVSLVITDDRDVARGCAVPTLLVRGGAWSAEPRFAAAIDVAAPDSET